jgi:hypothetical protein
MAVKGPEPLPYTLVAGADLSNAQHLAMAVNASGQAVICNIGADGFIGVLENKPKQNEHATIICGPAITKIKAGLAVTAGNYLTVQSGWAIPGNKLLYTTGASGTLANVGSKTNLLGIALETVASGATLTAKLFETFTTVVSA